VSFVRFRAPLNEENELPRGCKYANARKASGAGFDSPRLSKRRVRQQRHLKISATI
jgi:hypothetical protein